MNLDAVLSFLAATLRTATPIALATLACTISERAGVINIGIEGTMSGFCAVQPPESFLQQSLQACPFIAAVIR